MSGEGRWGSPGKDKDIEKTSSWREAGAVPTLKGTSELLKPSQRPGVRREPKQD